MAVVGYARVSTNAQKLDVQLDKLNAECEKIYREKRSASNADRPQLKAMLDYVREGDTVVVTKLDRIARSTLALARILNGLDEKGVAFRVIDQAGIDTSTREGKLLLTMLGAIAEFELDIRKERQMEGIAKAKENGVSFGRKALGDETIEAIRSMREEGHSVRSIAKELGISTGVAGKYAKLLSSENG